MTETTSPVDHPKVIAATFALGALAAFVAYTMPIWLGLVAARYSMSEAELGTVSAIYFGAFALSALSSVLWSRSINWRYLGSAGGLVFGLGFLAAALVPGKAVLIAGMIVAGAGGGALLALSYTITSDMADVDRKLGLKILVEQLYPALLVYLYSIQFADQWQLREAFIAIAAVIVLTSTMSFLLPAGNDHVRDPTVAKTQASGAWVFIALSAVTMFFGGFIVFWTFLGGLGQANGFSAATIGKWVAVGILTYGAGGLLTALLGDRVGRVLPIGIASIATVVPLIFLAIKVDLWQFAFAAAVIPAASAFGLAYQMGFVALTDVTGRYASLIAAAVALAAMTSTAIGGVLIEIYGYRGLYVLVAGLTCVALGLCIWLSIQMHDAEYAADTA